MCVCLCVFVCVCVCVYLYVSVYMYVCVWGGGACVCLCVSVCACVCVCDSAWTVATAAGEEGGADGGAGSDVNRRRGLERVKSERGDEQSSEDQQCCRQ